MSRDNLTATNATESQKPSVRSAYFVKIDFPSEVIAITNADRDMTFDGVTYLADGRLKAPGTIDERTNLRQEAQELVVSGLDSDLITLIRDDAFHYSLVTVHLGFLDDTGELIAGTDPHPLLIDGLLSQAALVLAERTGDITITVENRAILLQRTHNVKATKAGQQRRYPTDTGLNLVHTMEDTLLIWGGPQKPGTMDGGIPYWKHPDRGDIDPDDFRS